MAGTFKAEQRLKGMETNIKWTLVLISGFMGLGRGRIQDKRG